MNRFPDWRERLHAYIESRHQAAFSWAHGNGAIFTAGAVQAMTGRQLYPQEFTHIADPADVSAEAAARAILQGIEAELRDAQQERALRVATAKSQAAAFDHALRDEAEMAVREQEQVIEGIRIRITKQAAAVATAAKRVADPILVQVEARGGLEAMVTQRLGEPLAGILLAREGDVLMAPVNTGGHCLGICLGAYGAFVADEGLSKIRLLHCTKAWRIPETVHEHLNRRAARAKAG